MGWLSSAIGAVAGIFGSHQAANAQQSMAREQMDWMERMSNTAHQREVKDLRAAGLNPILSVNKGASTPTSGFSAYTGHAQDITSGVNAGTAIAQQRQQARLMKEQERNIAADTQVKLATAAKESTAAEFVGLQILSDIGNTLSSAGNFRSMTEYRDNALTANTQADTRLKEANIDLVESQRLLNNAQRFSIIWLTPLQAGKLQADIDNIHADTAKKVSETELNYIKGVTEKVYQGNLDSQTAVNRLTAQGIPYDVAVKEVNAADASAGLKARQDSNRYYGTSPDDAYGGISRVLGNLGGLGVNAKNIGAILDIIK